MKVEQINFQAVKDWVLYKHYAHRIPSISYAFGLFDGNILVGCCTFGLPPSPPLMKGAFGGKYMDIFLELNRLVVNDGLPKNTLSWFVSQCLKKLPTPMVVVSYADSAMGHHGYIYQATNWIYTGLSASRRDRDIEGIANKHSRHLFDSIGGINNALKNGINLKLKERSRKHRYFYFLGTKKQKKEMLKNLQYKIESYPKGDNKRYDASYKPVISLTLF